MQERPHENVVRMNAGDLPIRTDADRERLRRVAAEPDEALVRRASEDPDAPPLSDEALAQMRAVKPPEMMTVLEVVERLNDADDETLTELLQMIALKLHQRAERRRKADAAGR